jgi:hypothetical protein
MRPRELVPIGWHENRLDSHSARLCAALSIFLFLFCDVKLNDRSHAVTSPDRSRKGHDMFGYPVKPRKVPDENVLGVWRIKSRSARFKFYLPSPFLLAIVLVFVVLPLVWPESDDPPPSPSARAVFDLAADVSSLTISADAQHLAATCRDRPVWVWVQGREVNWAGSLQGLLPGAPTDPDVHVDASGSSRCGISLSLTRLGRFAVTRW